VLQITRTAAMAALLALSLFAVGCASPAPNYVPSIDNVELLKKSGGEAAKVGLISVKPDTPGGKAISLRASTMVSAQGTNFGDYIAAALRQELELAKMYDVQSGPEITGELLRNNIDSGGFSTNDGQIEARFVVKRDAQVRFDKIKRIDQQWESSFAGAVAIPLARNNYPLMVQKLFNALISDADFIRALRK
jgi:hypothetical protein